MPEPAFRLVSVPSALNGGPTGWATELLRDGEFAVLAYEGLDAINRLAHELGRSSVTLLRTDEAPDASDQIVVAWADSLPLIWIAPGFSDAISDWAKERGPMTLLVASGEPLSDEDRARIDRFVQVISRQSE